MVFNATFNNISVVLWWSVSLVEETGVPRENHRPAASIEYTSPCVGIKLTTFVVIGTDCTSSCKSIYHTITTTIVPVNIYINLTKDWAIM